MVSKTHTPIGKALLPKWEADRARQAGTLLSLSAAVRGKLAKMNTQKLRRFIRAAQSAPRFSQGRTFEGVFIPLGTMCAEYQARTRAEAPSCRLPG